MRRDRKAVSSSDCLGSKTVLFSSSSSISVFRVNGPAMNLIALQLPNLIEISSLVDHI